jgi:hypothetical protein
MRVQSLGALAHSVEGGRCPVWRLASECVRGLRKTICGFALVATLCASAWVAAPAHSAAVAAKPHGLTLLFNGKKLPITPFSGPDHYVPIKPVVLHVAAHWLTNLQGTGYKVVISTTEPGLHTYATCVSGTSCIVRKPVPIVHNEEMSWTVRVIKVQPHRITILSGFMVCLIGH